MLSLPLAPPRIDEDGEDGEDGSPVHPAEVSSTFGDRIGAGLADEGCYLSIAQLNSKRCSKAMRGGANHELKILYWTTWLAMSSSDCIMMPPTMSL